MSGFWGLYTMTSAVCDLQAPFKLASISECHLPVIRTSPTSCFCLRWWSSQLILQWYWWCSTCKQVVYVQAEWKGSLVQLLWAYWHHCTSLAVIHLMYLIIIELLQASSQTGCAHKLMDSLPCSNTCQVLQLLLSQIICDVLLLFCLYS